MLIGRLVVSLALAGGVLALPMVPSYATDPVTDVYVATPANGGSDDNLATGCTHDAPCASIAAGIVAADATGTTIHVGAGAFDGPVRPGAVPKSVTIDGDSVGTTTLTASEGSDGYDATVVELYGDSTTTLSNLTVSGGPFAGIVVDDPAVLHAHNVAAGGGGCDLYVAGGMVDVTDSEFTDGGEPGGCGEIPNAHSAGVAVDGGSLLLGRVQILDPTAGSDGLVTAGGTTTLDASYLDSVSNQADDNDSVGVHGTGGTVTVTRTTVTGFGSGAVNEGATATFGDVTFEGNVAGVTGESGTTTVVRSTFQAELGSLQGTVRVAGSILGDDSIQNCNGTITDLGYNLATDDSCDFTSATSRENVADLDLDPGLTERGGHIETVGISNPSSAMDVIPVGATYGDEQTQLCPATGESDLRGVPRPVGGVCDAGSMELAGTLTTLKAPAKAAPGKQVDLEATVDVPDVGVDGIGIQDGTVTFLDGDHVLCDNVPVTLGQAACTATFKAGRHAVRAVYAAGAGTIVHSSRSTRHRLLVGTVPRIKGPGRVRTEVGRAVSVTLRATGNPTATLSVRGRVPRGLHVRIRPGKVTISGRAKPSAVGRHRLRITAVNIMGEDHHRLTIVIRRR